MILLKKTSGHGVEIEGVLVKDSIVKTDDIQEKTSGHGVEIDGVLLKDGGLETSTTGKNKTKRPLCKAQLIKHFF